MRPWLAAALVLSAALGCIGSNGDDDADGMAPFAPFTPPPPDFDFSTLIDPDHARHDDASLHEADYGLALVAHASVADVVPSGMPGSITAIDVQDGWGLAAGMSRGVGFVLLDISDAAAPKAVSMYEGRADGMSARFSADGNHVFYACQLLAQTLAPVPFPEAPTGTNCDAGATRPPTSDPYSSIVVVDIRDRANPTYMSSVWVRGGHNIQTAVIDGVEYVFTNAVEVLRFDPEAGTLEIVAEVPGQHDTTVVRHPVTGDWTLYTGAGGGSFAIYNVNEPTAPEPVYSGGLTAPDGEPVIGWHEQVAFPYLLDGRALLAVGGEAVTSATGSVSNPTASPRSARTLYVVDVTDPVNPTLLVAWEPPFDPQVPWFQYNFSIHEMAATPTGQLAIAWYHAGVWVVDLSTRERQAEPVVLGVYQPHEPVVVLPTTHPLMPVPVVPWVHGAGWDSRGYLVVPDAHTGVYVLEPEWGLVPGIDGGQ